MSHTASRPQSTKKEIFDDEVSDDVLEAVGRVGRVNAGTYTYPCALICIPLVAQNPVGADRNSQ